MSKFTSFAFGLGKDLHCIVERPHKDSTNIRSCSNSSTMKPIAHRLCGNCGARLKKTCSQLCNTDDSSSKSNRKAKNRNWSNQKANPALKTKTRNK